MTNSKIQYHVNAEKGLVFATIKGTKNDAIDFINRLFKNPEYPKDKKNFLMPDTYRAVARCNFDDGDIFDLETGKHIAKNKLQAKIKNSKNKRAKLFAELKKQQLTRELESLDNKLRF